MSFEDSLGDVVLHVVRIIKCRWFKVWLIFIRVKVWVRVKLPRVFSKLHFIFTKSPWSSFTCCPIFYQGTVYTGSTCCNTNPRTHRIFCDGSWYLHMYIWNLENPSFRLLQSILVALYIVTRLLRLWSMRVHHIQLHEKNNEKHILVPILGRWSTRLHNHTHEIFILILWI